MKTIMKKLLFIIALFCGQISFGQSNSKIDTSNYYNYFSPKSLKGNNLTTNWLRLNDVVPIMLEELKKAGYDWLYDRTIYKLQNGQHINISAYSRKNNIGFLYIEGHDMFPNKRHRNILFQKDNSKVKFIECVETYSGEADFIGIKEIPSNVFVLKEDCYFFQYTNNVEDNKVLVTKEIAIDILRQDLRKYLSTASKPK
jgi:hypothetical protein